MKHSELLIIFGHLTNELHGQYREGKIELADFVRLMSEMAEWFEVQKAKPGYTDDRDRKEMKKAYEELILLTKTPYRL